MIASTARIARMTAGVSAHGRCVCVLCVRVCAWCGLCVKHCRATSRPRARGASGLSQIGIPGASRKIPWMDSKRLDRTSNWTI